MKKLMTMLGGLGASFVLVASASAAPPVPYQFDGVASYQFGGPPPADFHFGPNGNPDTSFVVITNNSKCTTFSGTIGFNAIGGNGFNYSSSYPVILGPGDSASVSINDEASNQGGYNGTFNDPPNAQQGAEFVMNGTVSVDPACGCGSGTEPVTLSIFDKDIHSGVFRTNPFGVSLDNYILQGGDPFGRDTEDAYEVTQAPGPFQFAVNELCHYMCYTVLPAQTLPPQSVTLEDQFREATVTRTKAIRLCNPVDKNGENPGAVTQPDHLVTYAITQSVPPSFSPVNGLVVTDQFGTLFIDAVTPNGLLVPSAKSLIASPAPPTDPAVDHFVCYTVKITAGKPAFVRVSGVNLVDQFGARTVDLSKPSRLCNPVNKNGEEPGAETHPGHLMCYETQRSEGQPYFTAVSPIFVNNQFGPQQLKATTPSELCVPALKTQ